MDRVIVLNPIEPAPLSLRTPQGLDLQLQVQVRDVTNTPVDPDAYIGASTLTLMPRSSSGLQSYAMETYDPVNGIISVLIPGEQLKDPLGYTLELWSAQLGQLVAAGTVAIRVGAYGKPALA